MTSLTNTNNHRRTKPKAKAKNISDDNNMTTTTATTTIGMKSLKESLSSMILQDVETKQKQQRQRHNKRGISSGAQKIMDKLASLRSEEVVHVNHHGAAEIHQAACHRNNHNDNNHRRRRRPSKLNNDNTNNDNGDDQPLPRLIGVHNNTSSSSLDTSSYSYSSFSSLDDSLRRLSSLADNQRLEKDDYNNDKYKYKRNDTIMTMTASTSTSTNIHNEPPPPSSSPSHKKEPTTTTITRRKSIPRHRNSELNSSISSCLRHPSKYNTSTNSSDRSIDTRRTFNSSMEDFNDSCSSWVASGVVIAESMEVIHMNE